MRMRLSSLSPLPIALALVLPACGPSGEPEAESDAQATPAATSESAPAVEPPPAADDDGQEAVTDGTSESSDSATSTAAAPPADPPPLRRVTTPAASDPPPLRRLTGASGDGGASAPPTAAEPATPPTDEPAALGSEAAREAAFVVLNRMVAAYRDVPVLVDELELDRGYGGQSPGIRYGRVVLGPDKLCELKTPNTRAVAVDGMVYYEDNRSEAKYIGVPLGENLVQTMLDTVQFEPGVAWHAKSRYGFDAPSILRSVTYLDVAPRILGVREGRLDDGTVVDDIILGVPDGGGTLSIDRETGFVRAMDMEYIPPGAPADTFKAHIRIRSTPKVYETMPFELTFDPAGRERVGSVDQLRSIVRRPVPVEIDVPLGGEVPDFTEFEHEGGTFTLSEHRGKIVVITAWHPDSVEFRTNTARFKQLELWLAEQGFPIEVETRLLHTRDRSSDFDKWDNGFEFWVAEEFKSPSIFDPENRIAELLGIDVIPVTLVIDPQGRLVLSQGGLATGWLPTIQDSIVQTIMQSMGSNAPAGPAGPGG